MIFCYSVLSEKIKTDPKHSSTLNRDHLFCCLQSPYSNAYETHILVCNCLTCVFCLQVLPGWLASFSPSVPSAALYPHIKSHTLFHDLIYFFFIAFVNNINEKF